MIHSCAWEGETHSFISCKVEFKEGLCEPLRINKPFLPGCATLVLSREPTRGCGGLCSQGCAWEPPEAACPGQTTRAWTEQRAIGKSHIHSAVILEVKLCNFIEIHKNQIHQVWVSQPQRAKPLGCRGGSRAESPYPALGADRAPVPAVWHLL